MPMPAGRPAVFLDRDGVITALRLDRGPRETARTPDEVALLPGAREALIQLHAAGFPLVIVTNQPNLAKGKTTPDLQAAMEERFATLLGPEAALDASYTCLHHPDTAQVVRPELRRVCDCRKPAPGLLLRAAAERNLDLRRSVIIGDHPTDMEAGFSVGCRTIRLVTSWSPKQAGEPPADAEAGSLLDAVPAVLHFLGLRVRADLQPSRQRSP